MPRPKKPGDENKEVKKRSRNGCWPCKGRKVKCGEEKPECLNCTRQGETCDYRIRLNWDGRSRNKDNGNPGSQPMSFGGSQSPPKSRGPEGQSSRSVSPATSTLSQTTSQHGSPGRSHEVPPLPAYLDPVRGIGPSAHARHRSHNGLMPPTWQHGAQYTGHPSVLHLTQPPIYPSPAESGFGSPATMITNPMPPPLPTSNPQAFEIASSMQNNAKRVKLSPRAEMLTGMARTKRASSYGAGEFEDISRPVHQPLTPTFFPAHLAPLTPAPSAHSDDKWNVGFGYQRHAGHENHDFRRVSVSSLLSGSPEPDENRPKVEQAAVVSPEMVSPFITPRPFLHQRTFSNSTETYGQDKGHADLDLPKNNDTLAISGGSPLEASDVEKWMNAFDGITEFGFRLQSREMVFAKGGYYASPVPIKIPRKLEPLPSILLENPMNLLYFHHFLNHTSRILVPHDCPENPFRTILPDMAIKNPHLLHLLLAYSASHRARLLSHPEPSNRIASYVRDVFPALRRALDDLSNAQVSNANLATAIMLTSLEIISPATFGIHIPWQAHLNVARDIIKYRSGGPEMISRKDPALWFLTRWLAYLDVLGSLSGRTNEEPLFGGAYWSTKSSSAPKELSLIDEDDHAWPANDHIEDDANEDYRIDCLLGFTTRCVAILAQIASLARRCDWERLDPETNRARPEWRPSPSVLEEAEKLQAELEVARTHSHKQCPHHGPECCDSTSGTGATPASSSSHYGDGGGGLDAIESTATNSAFHWAGLIHLLRRVHNLPRSDLRVQNAVREIVGELNKVRKGGNVEACLLFPMFTAGVEAEEQSSRDAVLDRVKGAEGVGMCQVGRARALMEEVWRTGKEWEGLVKGEFFG